MGDSYGICFRWMLRDVVLLLSLLARGALAYPTWAPVPVPLSTPWARDVRPDQLPAYPRPQLVRVPEHTSWQSLNGLWELDYEALPSDIEDNRPPQGKKLPHQILVPYPLESSLSGVRALAPNFTMFYRREFPSSGLGAILPACEGKKLLHVEKSDWNTTVWVNGVLVCNHVGGYDPFSCTLPTPATEIIIGVYDATEANPQHWQPVGKQQRTAFSNPSGMMYTGSSGIWDTVWAECVPASYIADVWARPDIDAHRIEFDVDVKPSPAIVNIIVTDSQGVHVASGSGLSSSSIVITLKPDVMHLWSPSSPYLYNATVSLTESQTGSHASGNSLDTVVTYFGMRKISIGAPAGKRSYAVVQLNNMPFYQIGTLDQGWFPDGLYAAATDAALVSDLKAMKAMGFNAVRKHMKVDTRRWFYHADRLGFLVWQDIPAQQRTQKEIIYPEIQHIWTANRNSPALVQWEGFNEGWGELSPSMVNDTMQMFRGLEKHRLLDDASGGRGFGCADGWVDPDSCPNHGQGPSRCMSVFWTGGCGNASDVVDHHHYPEPVVPYDLGDIAASQGKPFLLGEYGGYSLDVKGHMWTSTGEYTCDGKQHSLGRASAPGTPPDKGIDDSYAHYNELAGGLLARGLAGQIFTQITDVECERNGLLTYDRVAKVDVAKIREVNEALLQKASKLGLHVDQNRMEYLLI